MPRLGDSGCFIAGLDGAAKSVVGVSGTGTGKHAGGHQERNNLRPQQKNGNLASGTRLTEGQIEYETTVLLTIGFGAQLLVGPLGVMSPSALAQRSAPGAATPTPVTSPPPANAAPEIAPVAPIADAIAQPPADEPATEKPKLHIGVGLRADLKYDDLANIWAGQFLPPSERNNLSGPYCQNAWNYPSAHAFPSVDAGRTEVAR